MKRTPNAYLRNPLLYIITIQANANHSISSFSYFPLSQEKKEEKKKKKTPYSFHPSYCPYRSVVKLQNNSQFWSVQSLIIQVRIIWDHGIGSCYVGIVV